MSNTRSVSSPPGKAGDSVEDLISSFIDVAGSNQNGGVEQLIDEFTVVGSITPDGCAQLEGSASVLASSSPSNASSIVSSEPSAQPHVLRIVWDADGCAYNSTYRKALFFFINEFVERIEAIPADIDADTLKIYRNELLEVLHGKFINGEYKYKSDAEFNQVYTELSRKGKERLINNLKELGLSEWCLKIISEMPPESVEWETVALRVIELKNADAEYYFRCLRENQAVNWVMQESIAIINKFSDAYYQYIFASANVPLAGHFAENKDRYSEVVLMVGSNRQSYEDDERCKWLNSTGSIFKDLDSYLRVLQAIFPEKPVKMDRTTMTDIQNRLFPGESFNRILAKHADHASYLWDEKKGTMLYAFCHRAAVEHLDTKVTVKFIDDRADIIERLQALFSDNYDDNLKGSDLLPKGLTLNLIRYDGEVRYEVVIEGTGEIDQDYMCSSMIMSGLSDVQSPEGSRVIIDSVDSLLKQGKVSEFMRRREAEKAKVMSMSSLAFGGTSSFFAPRRERNEERLSRSYTFGATI